MSIIRKISFAVECDGCGNMIHDKDDGYYFETLKDANFMVKINGWGKKSTYLMDLLSVVETEDVIIESNNDKQAIMIRPDDSEIKGRVRMILMPMMLD